MQKTAFFPKPLLLDIFVKQNFSRIGPCESFRPEDSENVVLFGRATFLTGVIAAQSQQRAEKVGVSPEILFVVRHPLFPPSADFEQQ